MFESRTVTIHVGFMSCVSPSDIAFSSRIVVGRIKCQRVQVRLDPTVYCQQNSDVGVSRSRCKASHRIIGVVISQSRKDYPESLKDIDGPIQDTRLTTMYKFIPIILHA